MIETLSRLNQLKSSIVQYIELQIKRLKEVIKEREVILVVDLFSLQFINELFSMAGLLELGISVISNLHNTRQPLANWHCIYLISDISSTIDSVSLICKEWQEKSIPLYRSVSIYFLYSAAKEQLMEIAKTDIVENLVEVKDLYLYNYPIEPNVYIPFKYVGAHADSGSAGRVDISKSPKPNPDQAAASGAFEDDTRALLSALVHLQVQMCDVKYCSSDYNARLLSVVWAAYAGLCGQIEFANAPAHALLVVDRGVDLLLSPGAQPLV